MWIQLARFVLAECRKEEEQLKNRTRKAFAVILCTLMLVSVFALSASASKAEITPRYTPVSVYMNGKQVLEGRSVLIDSVTYVAIRSFAELVDGGEVTWDARARTAYVKNGSRVISATDGNYYISLLHYNRKIFDMRKNRIRLSKSALADFNRQKLFYIKQNFSVFFIECRK